MNFFNQGFQQPNPMYYGMQDQMSYGGQTFKPIRYNKGQIIQGLKDYIFSQTGVMVTSEVKLEYTPTLLRHACAEAKISGLQPCVFQVPEMGLQFQFYFCRACERLFYPADFM